MKRVLALSLALVMLLLPMTGSAATWGDIVSGLNSTGAYSGDGLDAEAIYEENYDYVWIGSSEPAKGKIEGNVDINMATITGMTNDFPLFVDLVNVSISDSLYITSSDNEDMNVYLEDADIDGNVVLYTDSGAVELYSNGLVNVGNNIYAKGDNGFVYLGNEGELNARQIHLFSGNEGVVGFDNEGEINTEKPWRGIIYGTSPGYVIIDNSGTVTNESTEEIGKVTVYLREYNGEDLTEIANNCVNVTDKGKVEVYIEYMGETLNEDPILIIGEGEGGGPAEDDPSKDWEPSPYERLAHEMEEKRQAQAAGNVMASPWWGYQLNLGYASRNLWVRGKDGERIFHKSFTSFIPNEAHEDRKNLTLQVKGEDMTGVNIRFDESVLDVFDRVFIEQITVVNENNEPYMQYQVSDLRAAREKYGLKPDELLLVGGTNDQVMRGTDHDGEFVSVESSENAKEAAGETTEEKAAE